MVFIKHIQERLLDTLRAYTLPVKANRLSQETAQTAKQQSTYATYKANIAISRETIANGFIGLQEHMLSAVTEIIQIAFLENIVKTKNPKLSLKLYKPPLEDDLRANTDCLLFVKEK